MLFRDFPPFGTTLIEPEANADERGVFARLFDVDAFREHGLPTEFVQASTSYNIRRATLRGLHYQAELHAETKLVRCTAGALFDVIVDFARLGKLWPLAIVRADRQEPAYAHRSGRLRPRLCDARRRHRDLLSDDEAALAGSRARHRLERSRPRHCVAVAAIGNVGTRSKSAAASIINQRTLSAWRWISFL